MRDFLRVRSRVVESRLFPFRFNLSLVKNNTVGTPKTRTALARAELDSVKTWCEENFGPCANSRGNRHVGRWCYYRTLITFRERGDAAAFKLLWC